MLCVLEVIVASLSYKLSKKANTQCSLDDDVEIASMLHVRSADNKRQAKRQPLKVIDVRFV